MGTRRNRRTWWIALTGVAVLTLGYAQQRDLHGLYEKYRHSQEKVGIQEFQLDRLTTDEAALHLRVEQLKSDPLEMEAAIRETRHFVRPGETIYRVLLPEETAPQQTKAL